MSYQILPFLFFLNDVHGIRNTVCTYPEFLPDDITIYHDAYHSMLWIEWNLPEQMHVIMRSQLGSRALPSCDDIKTVLIESPTSFDWTRDEAISHVGSVIPDQKSCPKFPLQLYQNSTSLTIDCFFFNQGDSRITWYSEDSSRCLGQLSVTKINHMCSQIDKYIQRIANSAGIINAKQAAENQKIIVDHLLARRAMIADSSDDDENDDEDSDWD